MANARGRVVWDEKLDAKLALEVLHDATGSIHRSALLASSSLEHAMRHSADANLTAQLTALERECRRTLRAFARRQVSRRILVGEAEIRALPERQVAAIVRDAIRDAEWAAADRPNPGFAFQSGGRQPVWADPFELDVAVTELLRIAIDHADPRAVTHVESIFQPPAGLRTIAVVTTRPWLLQHESWTLDPVGLGASLCSQVMERCGGHFSLRTEGPTVRASLELRCGRERPCHR